MVFFAAGSQVEDLELVVSSHVSGAHLVENIGSELKFVLPTNHGQLAHFEELFRSLEERKQTLGISSYGISDSSLEEVTEVVL